MDTSSSSSRPKDSSSSIAHLEYLRALTKAYQQHNFSSQQQSSTLAAYQELMMQQQQQQQKQNQQQQILQQMNQRRSMEDVLKKLASVGRESVDQKGDKLHNFETSRYL